jgi:hypothetical protein
MAFGQRWVSTPACRAARAVDGPLLSAVHYVTLYLMTEPVEQTLDEFLALGGHLRDVGRFHQHRRALLSGPFALRGARAAPRVLISAEAVAYRPNRGTYIVVEDLPPGQASPRPAADIDALLDVPGVAGVWSFAADPDGDGPWHPGRRRVTVCFLDEDALAVSGPVGQLVGGWSSASGAVVHAGPLETITPWRWDWFDGEAGPP